MILDHSRPVRSPFVSAIRPWDRGPSAARPTTPGGRHLHHDENRRASDRAAHRNARRGGAEPPRTGYLASPPQSPPCVRSTARASRGSRPAHPSCAPWSHVGPMSRPRMARTSQRVPHVHDSRHALNASSGRTARVSRDVRLGPCQRQQFLPRDASPCRRLARFRQTTAVMRQSCRPCGVIALSPELPWRLAR